MPYIPTMPKNRLIPAVGLMIAVLCSFRSWAQPPIPPAPAPGPAAPAPSPNAAAAPEAAKVDPPTAEDLFLEDAMKAVAKLESVDAELVQSVEMLEQKFQIQGRYVKAPRDRFYLKLELVGLPDSSGTMLQVCDGTSFWEYQKVFENQLYRRLDAGAILAKLRESELDDSFREIVLTQLGFGGPDVLLKGLRKTIRFNQKEKGMLGDRPVWILRGNWTNYDGLLPNAQPLPTIARLPSYVPSLVSVYLGADDMWPYKVTLVSQRPSLMFEDTRPIGPDGKRIGPLKNVQKPLLTRIELNYSNVKLNGPVAETLFVFQAPAGSPVEDRTREILDRLEQHLTLRAAQKKADAAKSEDPLLNQQIAVPKAAPADAPPAIPGAPGLPK
jgi:outer membrane lipoprotein-sorting protein